MNFNLTVLGSNSALPTIESFSTAHLLNASERFFLIDCGEGTQMQLRRFRIKFSKIKHIFISHLHGDHFFGLFGVLSSFNLLGRQTPMTIHAHPKLKKILDFHASTIGNHDFPVYFEPIEPGYQGRIYEDERVTVDTFPLKHRLETSGFFFREKLRPRNIKKEAVKRYGISLSNIWKIKNGADFYYQGTRIPNQDITLPPYKPRSYAFCSDTAYSEAIIPHIQHADILYHEASFKDEFRQRAEETAHSTTKQAATIARKAEVGKLIIGHFSGRHKDDIDNMVEEAREIFPETYAAADGSIYEVPQTRLKE